jgi:hypothetical protein
MAAWWLVRMLRWKAEDVADEMAPHGVGVTTPGATGP